MENMDKDLLRGLRSGKLNRRDFILKSIEAGFAVTGIASALAACAPAPTAAPTSAPAAAATSGPAPLKVDGKLTMKLRAGFVPQGNEILSVIVQDWGKKNNLAVSVDIVSMNDLQTITASAAETGAGPDIVEINQGSAHLFDQKLVDLSDVADDLGKRYGGWYAAAEEACKVNAKWKSLPRFFAPHAINYRKDLFDKVGATKPPKTWEELYEVGKALKAAKLAPIGFPLGHAVGDGNDFAYSVLWSYGGSDVAADGKTVAIDSAGTRAALEYMKKLFTDAMPPEVLSYDDAANNRTFNAGSISATNNASSIYGNARNQAIQIKDGDKSINLADVMDHFAYPAGPAGQVTYAEFMSSAIMSYSKNIDAAKALLKYLNEKEQISPWAMPNVGFVFPALKVYKDDVLMPWNTNAKLTSFKDYAATSHLPGYPSKNFRSGTDAYAKWLIVDMFASVANGKSVDSVIASTATQLKTIYGG